MDTQMDDGNGRTKTSVGGESGLSELGTYREPQESMLFESEESAKAFYEEYASRIGFVTRVVSSRKSERDGSIISRTIGCRGDFVNQVNQEQNSSRREGCMAMILLKREKSGQWVVRKFVKDHNHPLVVQLQKGRPIHDERDKKIQELTAEIRVKKRLSEAYRDQLLAFLKDVEDHNGHISLKLKFVFDNLKEIEAKRQEVLQQK